MKKRACILILAIAMTASLLSGMGAMAAVEPFLDESNWTQLDGYGYLGATAESPQKLKANVSFDESAETGINYRGKGYYKGGVNDYAGILFNEKVNFSDFSITFSINSLGGVESAADDSWIGIGMMKEKKGFNIYDKTFNNAGVMLLRPDSRSVRAQIHEIGEQDGESINNFVNGTGYPNVSMDTVPMTEGSIFRYELEKTGSDRFSAKLSQLKADGTVIRTKAFVLNLNRPEFYLDASDCAYLFLSASTTNRDREWNWSVLEINGKKLGEAPESSSMSPMEQASLINAKTESLGFYENVLPVFDEAQKKYTGAAFASPAAGAHYTSALYEEVKYLAMLFDTADVTIKNYMLSDNLVKEELLPESRNTDEDYLTYLDAAIALVKGKIETEIAGVVIAELETRVSELERLTDPSEQEHRDSLSAAKTLFAEIENGFREIFESKPATGNAPGANRYEQVKYLLNESRTALNATARARLDARLALVTQDYLDATDEENLLSRAILCRELVSTGDNLKLYGAELPANLADRVEALEEAIERATDDEYRIANCQKTAKFIWDVYFIGASADRQQADSVFENVLVLDGLTGSFADAVDAGMRARLEAVALSSLDDAIAGYLPAPDSVNQSNYLLNIDSVEKYNRYYLLLETFGSGTPAKLPKASADKITELMNVVYVFVKPISAENFEPEASYPAGTEITIDLSKLFRNPNGIELVYTASAGVIENGIWRYTPNEGEVTVSFTAKSERFDQTATNSLVIRGGKKKTESGGCGGASAAGLGLLTLCALGLLKFGK